MKINILAEKKIQLKKVHTTITTNLVTNLKLSEKPRSFPGPLLYSLYKYLVITDYIPERYISLRNTLWMLPATTNTAKDLENLPLIW